MVVDERPKEDFGKMILKVATGLVLPKLVDTFLNTAFNKNKVCDLTTETSDTIIQDNKNSTTDKLNLTVNFIVVDPDKLSKKSVITYQKSGDK